MRNNPKSGNIQVQATQNPQSSCPQCGKECEIEGNQFRPFCCERCKLLDLGNWMSGGYRIPEAEQEEWTEPVPDITGGKGF